MKKIILVPFLILIIHYSFAQNYRISDCSDTTFNGLYEFHEGDPVKYFSLTKVMFPKGEKTEGWIIASQISREPELPYLVNSDTNSLKYPPVKGWMLVSEKGNSEELKMVFTRINKQPYPVWTFPLLLFFAFIFVVRSGKKKSTRRGES